MTQENKNIPKTRRILVAFYSRDGHTKRIAEILAESLNADIDEIKDKKSRKGLIGFFKAGCDATLGKTTEIAFSKNPANYDIVVVGSPVWNGRVTPAVRTYLLKNKDRIKKIAFYVTCVGRQGKALLQMHEIYISDPLTEKVILRSSEIKGVKQFIESLKSVV